MNCFMQILDGETIREWMHPEYVAADRTGYCLPWELIPNGNYQMRCKAGAVDGYRAELMMIVRAMSVNRVGLPYPVQCLSVCLTLVFL